MAYPYPVIVFLVNLTPPTAEAFGPLTNQTLQGTDSPDNIVDTPNQTLINALKAERPFDRSTAMPSVLNITTSPTVGLVPPNPNRVKHGEIIACAGSAALETLKLYCTQAAIQAYLPGYTGPGAAPGFAILTPVYFGVDPF